VEVEEYLLYLLGIKECIEEQADYYFRHPRGADAKQE
jgi:hypothetical protein